MDKQEKFERAKAAVEARMLSGEFWTYAMIQEIEDKIMGRVGYPTTRIADSANQRFKKKGWATFKKYGRDTFWNLTDAGRAEAARRAAENKTAA